MRYSLSIAILLAAATAAPAQETIDATFIDPAQIGMRAERVEEVDAETQAWGRGVVAALGIE